jgi:hypothetical protein
MEQLIERTPYNKGFVLASDPDPRHNFQLVMSPDDRLGPNTVLRTKDTHGKIHPIMWGTMIILLENLPKEKK